MKLTAADHEEKKVNVLLLSTVLEVTLNIGVRTKRTWKAEGTKKRSSEEN